MDTAMDTAMLSFPGKHAVAGLATCASSKMGESGGNESGSRHSSCFLLSQVSNSQKERRRFRAKQRGSHRRGTPWKRGSTATIAFLQDARTVEMGR